MINTPPAHPPARPPACRAQLLPGKIEYGPETLTGHVPKYVNNGLAHCILFSLAFWAFSDLGRSLGRWGVLVLFGVFMNSFCECCVPRH